MLSAPAAHADVAYIDGNEVWVSTLDGSQKVRLSSGEGDWRDVAVSDQGYVVGIRLESGKVADLSSFTVWDPQGKRIKFGPLVGLRNGGTNAHPLNLQITPDGGLLVYGFSNSTGIVPNATFTTGFILLPSATTVIPALSPVNVTSAQYPSLVGERVVGAVGGGTQLAVQDASSIASDDFTPWPGTSISGGTINSLDISADGRRLAVNVASGSTQRLIAIAAPGLGQAPTPLPNPVVPGDVGDCFVPATGNTYDPSWSPDGTYLAWEDAGGAKVAGAPKVVPTDGVQNLCTMSSPIVTLSPTGRHPSIGPISVATLQPAAPGQPTPSGPPGPGQSSQITPGKLAPLTVANLGSKKGAAFTVTTSTAGKVSVTLTVKPSAVGLRGRKAVVIAKGSKQVQAGKAAKVRVKFTKTGKNLRKKLKGVKATLKIRQGTTTTTKTFRLR